MKMKMRSRRKEKGEETKEEESKTATSVEGMIWGIILLHAMQWEGKKRNERKKKNKWVGGQCPRRKKKGMKGVRGGGETKWARRCI